MNHLIINDFARANVATVNAMIVPHHKHSDTYTIYIICSCSSYLYTVLAVLRVLLLISFLFSICFLFVFLFSLELNLVCLFFCFRWSWKKASIFSFILNYYEFCVKYFMSALLLPILHSFTPPPLPFPISMVQKVQQLLSFGVGWFVFLFVFCLLSLPLALM